MSSESNSSSPAKKAVPAWLFGGLGVAVVAGIAAVANVIAREVPVQVDLTANKFYSLNEGTKKILEGLDTKVNMTLFVSDEDLPPQLVGRVRDVENLLLQYEKRGKGNIVFKKVTPSPATDEEDQAALAGIRPRQTPQGSLYFGLAFNCLDKSQTIEFVPDIADELLEYEVSRAVTNVFHAKKKVLGLMSALPIAGGGGGMMPMMGGGGSRPWVFHQQLSQNYEIKSVEMTAETIDESIDVLLVIHPAGITDSAEYAIDQFLMKGKRVIAMVDPEAVAAQSQRNPQMGPGGGQGSSNLPKLLAHWGYSFDSAQVIADMKFKDARYKNPGVITLGTEGVNDKSTVIGKLSDLTFVLSGGFTGKPADGLTEEWLVKSSAKNQLVSPTELNKNDTADFDQKFKSDERERYLALQLTGKFKTAFPTGKPAKEEEPKDAAKPEEKKDEPGEQLKESKEGAAVILVGDVDVIHDQFCFDPRFLQQGLAMPMNNNLGFAFNMIDFMAGDTNLVQIRSRASGRRAFSRINDIETAARDKIRDEVERLKKEADEADTKLQELQNEKDPSKKMLVSPEQQALIQNFRKTQTEAKKQIRQKEKDAMREIDKTKSWLKAANIGIMPVLALLAGIIIAVGNKRKTSAR